MQLLWVNSCGGECGCAVNTRGGELTSTHLKIISISFLQGMKTASPF